MTPRTPQLFGWLLAAFCCFGIVAALIGGQYVGVVLLLLALAESLMLIHPPKPEEGP